MGKGICDLVWLWKVLVLLGVLLSCVCFWLLFFVVGFFFGLGGWWRCGGGFILIGYWLVFVCDGWKGWCVIDSLFLGYGLVVWFVLF